MLTFDSSRFGSALFVLEGLEGELDSKAAQTKSYDWKLPKSLDDRKDPFVKWATAKTGVPMIDANMKELVATG